MDIIISTSLNEDDFRNFHVVSSFEEFLKVADNFNLPRTNVIIHSCKEDDFGAGKAIAELNKKGVKRFIGINKDISATMQMLITGTRGSSFKDEFYLEDEEELTALIEELDEYEQEKEKELPAAHSIDILKDFIEKFVNNDEKLKAPIYLDTVNQAVTTLEEVNAKQALKLTSMGESAVSVFERVSCTFKQMDENRKILEKQLDELSNANSTVSRPILGNSIYSFTSYKHMGSTRVLLVKEYSPCRYLTTFMLAYCNHVHYSLNKRVKLVFVHQKAENISSLYRGIGDSCASITQETSGIATLYDSEIVATNSPKREVMRDLLGKAVDLVIVVDRLYGSNDIVSGRSITKLNAVSGNSDIARYKLDASNTIFSVTAGKNGVEFAHLPIIKNFATEEDGKYAMCEQAYAKAFSKIDTKLGI